MSDVLGGATSTARAGSLRLFMRQHPWFTDITIALVYLIVSVGLGVWHLNAGARLAVLAYLSTMTIALVFRRCYPLIILAAAILLPVGLFFFLTLIGADPEASRMVLQLQFEGRPAAHAVLPFVDLLALSIAAFTVGSEHPLRISLPTIGLTLVFTAVITLVWGQRKFFVLWVVIIWLVLLIAYLIGSNVRSSRLRMLELENRARQLTLEHEQREQLAVSQERNRIAREMHDVVSHSLSVMVTLAEGAAVALDRNPDIAKQAVTELAQVGRDSLQDARRLVGVLRADATTSPHLPGQPSSIAEDDVPREPQPGEHDVRRLIESYRRAGMPVTLHESGPELPPDPSFHLAIYRIVQESLTNVLRYARASKRIDVTLSRSGRDTVITIENDAGDGQQVMPGSGKGVIGMRERAAVYDGTVHAGPTTTGWQVRATLRVPGQPHAWSSPV
ncbi:hypothetical protein BSZ39_07495 [Bowdeniella nasicola]|uniref:histidine kinase n=1 Tax=Bowdeniella nasicola TaxID=208480 RepID=A0A1Q5Q2A8_9ACTO|nr:histidine kinase [Bowdeniella nasicola]OKL53802.1 hypothetical protein BSZ39_07495 [Bowdeniella nasicola]